MRLLARLNIDPYVGAIVGMVALASLAPAHGVGLVVGGHATQFAIALLFFLHGAKLESSCTARSWSRVRR